MSPVRPVSNPGVAMTAPRPSRGAPVTATLLLAALSATGLAACSVDESLSPLSAGTTTTSSETTSSSSTTTTTPPDHGPLRRTVSVRNPMGSRGNNLMFDGDFELSTSAGTGQYGWRMFDSTGTGEVRMAVETGGLCRTGLTCVKLHKNEVLFGRGTAAPNEKGHVMEVWGKVPEGVGCAKVQAIAVDCDTFVVLKVLAADKQIPEDRWCRHVASFPASASAVCMYIQSSLAPDQEAIVDSAVLGPNDGTVALKGTLEEPLLPDTEPRLSNLRDLIRRTTQLGAPRHPPIVSPE